MNINGKKKKKKKKNVNLKSSLIKFKNYLNQSAVPYKKYAGFDPLMGNDRNNSTSYTEKYFLKKDSLQFYLKMCLRS